MKEYTIPVQVEWNPSGQVFLYADMSGLLGSDKLAYTLFAWDKRSFYGTMVKVEERNGRAGFVLSALDAIHYFLKPRYNSQLEVDFKPTWNLLHEAASQISHAVSQGQFAPDFTAWQEGQLRWKYVSSTLAETHPVSALNPDELPFFSDWFHYAVAQTLEDNREIAAAWEAVRHQYPGLDSKSDPLDSKSDSRLDPVLWSDEVEWWVSLGLVADPAPFYIGLALVEPGMTVASGPPAEESDFVLEAAAAAPEALEPAWTLAVVLHDKLDETTVFPWPMEEGLRNAVPPTWPPYFELVEKAQQRWLRVVPTLADERGNLKTRLTEEEALDFLRADSVRLLELGERVYLPNWWEEAKRLRARLKAKVKSSVGTTQKSMFGIQQIVQFDWSAAIGNLDLTPEEFTTLLANQRRLVEIRGRWVVLDAEFYTAALQKMKQVDRAGGLSLRDVLELHLLGSNAMGNRTQQMGASSQAEDGVFVDELDTELDAAAESHGGYDVQLEVELNQSLNALVSQLQDVKRMEPRAEPDGFQGKLRPYQRLGYSWLAFLRQFGLGACLADDMGLGKTVQYIAYLVDNANANRDAGAGTGRDASGEASHDAGADASGEATGVNASLLICPTSVIGNWEHELRRFAPGLKVYVHYGTGRKKDEAFLEQALNANLVLTTYGLANLDEDQLAQVTWNSLCLDEAQNIKNAYTKQAAAIRRLNAHHRIAMTGTPIENRLTELWSIFDFLNPGYLGSLNHFRSRFVNPIERTRDAELTLAVQRLVQPFLLRREKRDPAVELDLPDKLESKVYVPLTGEQAALYEATVQKMLRDVDTLSQMERRGAILTTLMKLKQVCNHPVVFMKENVMEKGLATSDWDAMVARSEKLTRLLEMVSELRAEGDKCLIFTQFVETGKLIQAAVSKELGEEVLFLYGSVTKAKRDEMIDRFQNSRDSSPGVLILSLKAGGVGLNLTAANHVFHFDRWWNPAVENQATDRAYRIGQQRRVQVYKFVTLGTLEERIDDMLEQKQSLSSQIIGTGENWITELSTDELRSMFALRREWVEE